MKRALVLVEGQTEETFVRDILGPHLLTVEILVTAILISTKRVKSGEKFKGGVTSYPQVRREVWNLLKDTGAAAVTTMMDYYGLPNDFPGLASLPREKSCYERVKHLEEAFREDIGHRTFLPYLSLHEFEALLLVVPKEIEKVSPGKHDAARLVAEVARFASPEEVNDGPETHPSARICRVVPGYQKRLHGPVIASRIGLAAIRKRCRHFDEWLRRLENLPVAPSSA
ncbi:MAG: DUF4276 family protein [Thermoanaerobaculia bacterium]